MEKFFENNSEFYTMYKYLVDELDQMEINNYKNKKYYDLLYMWLINRNNDKKIDTYLLDNNIQRIAIYGMGRVGRILFDELMIDKKINIEYVIDSNLKNENFSNIPLVSLEQGRKLNSVDAIIITPIYDFMKILSELKNFRTKKIIDIQCLVQEIYEPRKDKLVDEDFIFNFL